MANISREAREAKQLKQAFEAMVDERIKAAMVKDDFTSRRVQLIARAEAKKVIAELLAGVVNHLGQE